MKILVLFCFVSMLFIYIKIDTKYFEKLIIEFVDETQIYQSTDSLTIYFTRASDDSCNIWDKKYFCIFPSSFVEYKEIFGYKRPLNREYYKHLKLLVKIHDCINSSTYIEKLINLGIDGEWEADAIGDMQNLIKQRFNDNNKLFFQLLSKRNEDDIYSFFKFIFDGPIIENFESRWLNHKNEFPNVCDVMVKAHNDLKIRKNRH